MNRTNLFSEQQSVKTAVTYSVNSSHSAGPAELYLHLTAAPFLCSHTDQRKRCRKPKDLWEMWCEFKCCLHMLVAKHCHQQELMNYISVNLNVLNIYIYLLSSVSLFHLWYRSMWCHVGVSMEVHVSPTSTSLLAVGSTCVSVLRGSRATSATRTWTSVCRLPARSEGASTRPAGTGASVLRGWEVRFNNSPSNPSAATHREYSSWYRKLTRRRFSLPVSGSSGLTCFQV